VLLPGWLTAAPGGYRLAGRTVSGSRVAAVGLAVALAGVAWRRPWRVGRLGVTAVHEMGHALAARLTGRRVLAVHLRADTSGVTYHAGPAGWAGRLATVLAGYPAPGLVAVAGAWLCAAGHPRAWLALLAGLAAVAVVLWVRNLFGIVVVVIGAGGLGWLVVAGASGVEAVAGAVAVWYLALGGLRTVVESRRVRGPDDAAEAGRLLHVPASVVRAVLAGLAAASAGACAVLLFGPVGAR
jgi:hypothetical protein